MNCVLVFPLSCTLNILFRVLNRRCVCLCVFAVTVFLRSEWMSDLSQEKEHPSWISLLQWFMCRCLCAGCLYELSIAKDHAKAFSVHGKRWHLDENRHCCLTAYKDQDPTSPVSAELNSSLHRSAFHVTIGRNPMSASSPSSLPRAFLHSLSPLRPSSPSPPGPIYMRLSNGSHSVSSPTNSRGSFHGVSFLLQIGLTRETVNLEASDLSLSAVKDLVCSIVDQKVSALSHVKPVCSRTSRKCYLWCECFVLTSVFL